MTFGEVLDQADALNQDEREELVRILQSRLREERRAQLLEEVKAGEAEFEAGRCKPATAAQIMRRIGRK